MARGCVPNWDVLLTRCYMFCALALNRYETYVDS
jgi:hypothetical protein